MQSGLITRKEALARGISEDAIFRKLKRGDWQELFPKVYSTSPLLPSWEQRLLACCAWAGPDALVSHRAAAELLGLTRRTEKFVELTVVRNVRSSLPDVVLHYSRELPKTIRTKIGNIPITKPAWTVIDLGAAADYITVQEAYDEGRRRGLITADRLSRALEVAAGRPGVATARRLLKDELAIPESLLERRLFRVLVEGGLPAPIRQHPFEPYRIDLAYPDSMLAIEGDGFDSHSDREAFQHDRTKWTALSSSGWLVLCYTWEDVHLRPDEIVATVGRLLKERRAAPR
jgi:very-short-patch-repair endonuclease